MKKFLYIFSLLSFLSALLVIVVMPIDEVYSKLWLSIIIIIISFLLRVFSSNPKTLWVDFLVLTTSLILINIGAKLLSPTTEFLITYGDGFNKIYAGILTIFPIVQLLIIFRENYTFPKKIHLKIFILTIIVSLLTLGGIEIYGKTIDLKKLSGTEKIYLYSYGKYTPQLIEFALSEIEKGNTDVSQKMAMEYLDRNPNVVKENKERLSQIIFSKPLNRLTEEQQINLMIKIDPEKTLSIFENNISNYDFEMGLTIFSALTKIVNNSPQLIKRSCELEKNIIIKDKKEDEASQIRLKLYSRSLCGNLYDTL